MLVYLLCTYKETYTTTITIYQQHHLDINTLCFGVVTQIEGVDNKANFSVLRQALSFVGIGSRYTINDAALHSCV